MKIKYTGVKQKITISFPIGFQTRREIKKTVDFIRGEEVEIEDEKDWKPLVSGLESPFVAVEPLPEKKILKRRVRTQSTVMNESFVEDFEKRLGA